MTLHSLVIEESRLYIPFLSLLGHDTSFQKDIPLIRTVEYG